MNAQKSRKFVVALGMAAVVGTAVVIFALRAHSVTPTAQSVAPPAPLTPVASSPPAVAQIPDAAPELVQPPTAPVAVAHVDSVVTKKSAVTAILPAAEPKHARSRILPKADASTPATEDAVARTAPTADSSASSATAAVATNVEPLKSNGDLAATRTTLTAPTADQVLGTSVATPTAPPAVTAAVTPGTTPAAIPAAMPASDGQITINVKSEIAVNSLTRNTNIGVSTTDGVVALTGNLASQDAIDNVKDLVGKVKDVKSVDTSALIVASL